MMVEGHQKDEWSRTSAVLALTANANRDRKKKPTPYKPEDFNPTVKRKPEKLGTVEDLKAFFRKGE